jgi:Matrixin
VRAALFAAAAVVLLATSASYVRTRTQDGSHCLHWPAGPVTFVQSRLGYPPLGDAGFEAVTRSWQTWETQMETCGSLSLFEGALSPSRSVGFLPDGGSENLVLFRTVLCSSVVDAGDPCLASGSCGNAHDCWDHTPGVLALTTSTYRSTDGVLVDSDIELNAADGFFTVVDAPPCTSAESLNCVANDTQNTVTHEFGHLLGLAHSPDPSSTMYFSAPVGETSKRQLDPGSQQFVCDVYPVGQPSNDCLAPDGGAMHAGGCSMVGTGTGGLSPALALFALVAWAVRRPRH